MTSLPQPGPVTRELSLRAVITGSVLGILLTPSNVYAGLKIGWSFNMSIIAHQQGNDRHVERPTDLQPLPMCTPG